MDESAGIIRHREDLLRSMSGARGIAVPMLGPFIMNAAPNPNTDIFDSYGLRENFDRKKIELIGAIALLEGRQMLATEQNITRLAKLQQQPGRAYMQALVQVGLAAPAITAVYPYQKKISHDNGKLVNVRSREVGGFKNGNEVRIFTLTDEGASIHWLDCVEKEKSRNI